MSHFLRMRGLQRGEIIRLFARAAQLKRRRREGRLEDSLTGKTVVLLMEKASTRTRLSFAAAAFQLGGHAIELSAGTSQLARGEPLSDTARVISGYADAVVMRTTTDARLEEFARWSSVPVINGLTDGGHPVQWPGSGSHSSATARGTWLAPSSRRRRCSTSRSSSDRHRPSALLQARWRRRDGTWRSPGIHEWLWPAPTWW